MEPLGLIAKQIDYNGLIIKHSLLLYKKERLSHTRQPLFSCKLIKVLYSLRVLQQYFQQI